MGSLFGHYVNAVIEQQLPFCQSPVAVELMYLLIASVGSEQTPTRDKLAQKRHHMQQKRKDRFCVWRQNGEKEDSTI